MNPATPMTVGDYIILAATLALAAFGVYSLAVLAYAIHRNRRSSAADVAPIPLAPSPTTTFIPRAEPHRRYEEEISVRLSRYGLWHAVADTERDLGEGVIVSWLALCGNSFPADGVIDSPTSIRRRAPYTVCDTCLNLRGLLEESRPTRAED